MSRQNLRSARKLFLESLEGRSLMAGNVFVSNNLGELVITGDSGANEVTVTQVLLNGSPVPGRYFITGQNDTRIFGTNNGFVQTTVTGDIRINLGAGSDRLTVGNGVNGNFIAPRDLSINMGEGNNTVLVNRVSVRDDASIVTGAGSDSVTVRATVGIEPGVDFGLNDLNISTGNRNDVVRIENTFVRQNLTVDAAGTDAFTDIVDFIVGNVGGDTSISTGAGNDLIRVSEVGFNDDLTVNAGTGNDTVTISASEMDELIAFMGAGNDRLTLLSTTGQRASLNGGSEFDRFDLSGDSQFVQFPQPVSFEDINFI
jgi:hypothetical protein